MGKKNKTHQYAASKNLTSPAETKTKSEKIIQGIPHKWKPSEQEQSFQITQTRKTKATKGHYRIIRLQIQQENITILMHMHVMVEQPIL